MIPSKVSALAIETVNNNGLKVAVKQGTFLDVLNRGIPDQLRGNENYYKALEFIRSGSNGIANNTNDMDHIATQASKLLLKTSNIAQNVINVIIRNIIRTMGEELASYNMVTPTEMVTLVKMPAIFGGDGIGTITMAHALAEKTTINVEELVADLSDENLLYLIKTGMPSVDVTIEETVSVLGIAQVSTMVSSGDHNRPRGRPFECANDLTMPFVMLVLNGVLDGRHPTIKELTPEMKAKYSAMFTYAASLANAQKNVVNLYVNKPFTDTAGKVCCFESYFASLVRANPTLNVYNGVYVDLSDVSADALAEADKKVAAKEKNLRLEKLQRQSSYMRSRIMRIATKEIMAMNFSEEENKRILDVVETGFMRTPYGIGMDINDYLRGIIANAIDTTGESYDLLNIIDTYLDKVDSKNVEEAVIWAHSHLVSRFCVKQLAVLEK